ncbi:MAG: NAD+ synthase, partial [Omnitrophica bacterium]|nr:NAD+ synthase [Candidatus Omnitrophota bacterium]
MKKMLRIALAQINPNVGDLRGNSEKIADFIKQAQALEADIVVFPELAICGYPPEDLLLKEHFVRDNLKALHSLVKKISGLVAIIGFVDKDREGNLYNAAGIIQNGKLRGVCHKIELPNYGVFDERRYFQPGKRPFIFALEKIIFGVNICEDIWQAKGVALAQAKKGAKVIINISASPYYTGKGNLRKKILAERARQTKAYICYNNLVGGQDELVFDGGSMVLDQNGKGIIYGKQFAEDLIVADLPIITGKRKNRYSVKKPDLPRKKHEKLDKMAEIYSALVLGTGDYIRKNNFKKVVIGLSGGIDSALTALIAAEAVGCENVIGISMPSQYSSPGTQADAKILANNLGIKFIVVPINRIFDTYLALFAKEFAGLKQDVTEENLQARIRGNILMAFSNKFGWLVLTTGNKSETSV